VQAPDGLVTRYTYDQGSDPERIHALLSIEHPGSTHDYYSYDAEGRFFQTSRDGNVEQITYSYGPAGKVVAADPAGHTTQYFFDGQGLVAKEIDPLGNPVYLSYDGAFNLTQVTDAAGQVYAYRYDARGNLVQTTDPLGHTIAYAYSGPFDRLTSVTDANDNAIRYSYDPAGNLQATTYADNSVERLIDDPFGNPIQWTNRRGNPVQYQRDAAGHVTVEAFADGSFVQYGYDPVWGTLTSATDSTGTTTLTYDPQYPDRLSRVTYPNGRFLQFQYDEAGRRRQMVDQDGFTVNYHYDASGRLQDLTDVSGAQIVHYTYDPAASTDRLSRKDLGNGTYTTYQYTDAGQIQHLINHAPDGSINSGFDYTYDALGRVQTMTTLDGEWTYSYDAVGELTHAVFDSHNPNQVPNQDLQYFYDAAGNRTRTILNGVATDYVVNNLNEYTQVGADLYEYDKDGNLVSRQSGSTTETYTYNDHNQLVGVVTPAGSWTYRYDPFGDRVAATHSGQGTEYLLDATGLGTVVGEYNASGGLIAHYTQGLGLTSQVDPAGASTYFDFDALGSTVGLSGPGGTYLNSYAYLPFGGMLTAAGPLANAFTYLGQFNATTEGTGLDFMQARYYSSTLGRFSSTDPLGILGGNE
jgi:RHS repeat-associated protein